MTTGIWTTSSSGGNNLYTPNASSGFFVTSQNAQFNSSINTSPAIDASALSTPLTAYNITITNNQGLPRLFISTSGVTTPNGASYLAPVVNQLHGTTFSRDSISLASPIVNRVDVFGKLAATSEVDFGFQVQGLDGNLSVSQNYKTLYYQRNSSGAYIRQGVATSLQSFVPGTVGSNTTYYGQVVTQNIAFDRAHDTPPYIFITASDNMIAFNGMITNANGKFVGASVVSYSNFTTPSSFSGTAAYSATTLNFSYFLVSQDPPVFQDSSSYGMQVFNGSGEEVFNSIHKVAFLSKVSINTPYMFLNGGYISANSSALGNGGQFGFCINNFPSICGHGVYVSFTINSSTLGPFTMFGRYLHVRQSQADFHGFGSAAIFIGQPEANTGLFGSFDYSITQQPQMPVFFSPIP